MDILLTDDIIIDYRDADFGIDNSALEFDVGFENLLGPSVVVVVGQQQPSNVKEEQHCNAGGGGAGRVEQALPDSPPDSSGSPPSSVYSPVDIRQTRKRRRNSDVVDQSGAIEGHVTVDGTVLCDLMLGETHEGLKDANKELQSYSVANENNNRMMAMQGQGPCPYSTSTTGDDIKPLPGPLNHEPYPPASNNYVQLGTPGYYNNYLEYDNNNSYITANNSNAQQPEDLYSHQQQLQQQQQSHHTFVEMPTESHNLNASHNPGETQNLLMASPDPLQRKSRKMDTNSSFEEASPGTSATPDSQYNTSERGGLSMAGGGTEGGEGSLPGTPMQCIRFEPFQAQQWHALCDHQLHDLPVPHYRVDADKGFNFSSSDEAFVCQKKNHFQVTCHTQLSTSTGQVMTSGGVVTSPAGTVSATTTPFNVIFVRTQNGLEKVRNFCLHFYGVKFEAPRHKIRVEQSQSDRSKKVFHPVVIDLHCGQVSKTTVGRLHFSETTSNNMRKKGRPNPEQRYFRLVVALHAHTHTGDYPIVVHGSERIIVRASNPGQFENDFELCWQRGVTPDSIFHNGKIGLNTDQPDECLVVNGNLKVTGHILQPSDCRIKRELTELGTRQQLENIEKIRIVKYAYQDGRAGSKDPATGVMAQEVRRVIPDAVFEQQAAYQMPNGGRLEKFLVVNKDRIFLENVGAVKELSKVTGKLERRIEQLEISQSEMAQGKDLNLLRKSMIMNGRRLGGWEGLKLGNHSIQCIIVVLIIVMTVCLSTLATLFFVEHYDAVRSRYYESLGYLRRQDNTAADQAATAAHVLGSKQQSLAYSNNYSTMNDHVPGYGKSGKKSTYKADVGAGAQQMGSGSAAAGQNQMTFPVFTDSRSGTGVATGAGNNLAVDPGAHLQQLNWSNIEFSFLYIYKLQQYYNELQKKNGNSLKGKVPPFGEGEVGRPVAVGAQKTAGQGSDIMADSPSNTEEDCDSGEVTGGEAAEDNSPTGGGAADLKLDEEFMNRFLANILNVRNQSSGESLNAALGGAFIPELRKPKDIPSDNSAIDAAEDNAGAHIPDTITTVAGVGTKKKDLQQQKRLNESGQQQDLENLINSN